MLPTELMEARRCGATESMPNICFGRAMDSARRRNAACILLSQRVSAQTTDEDLAWSLLKHRSGFVEHLPMRRDTLLSVRTLGLRRQPLASAPLRSARPHWRSAEGLALFSPWCPEESRFLPGAQSSSTRPKRFSLRGWPRDAALTRQTICSRFFILDDLFHPLSAA